MRDCRCGEKPLRFLSNKSQYVLKCRGLNCYCCVQASTESEAKMRWDLMQSDIRVDEIQVERDRQVCEEGYTAEYDDRHSEGQLLHAAEVYMYVSKNVSCAFHVMQGVALVMWPWLASSFKPWQKRDKFPVEIDKRRCLVKAGALLLAEIKRLNRHGEETTKCHVLLDQVRKELESC